MLLIKGRNSKIIQFVISVDVPIGLSFYLSFPVRGKTRKVRGAKLFKLVNNKI